MGKPGKLPKIFKQEVDIDKVNLEVIKSWLEKKLDELVPNDDILVDYTYELIQNKSEIKYIHQQLIEFLGEEEAVNFCQELWKLMISAQDDKDGIPPQLVKRTNYKRSEKGTKPKEKADIHDRGSGQRQHTSGGYNRRVYQRDRPSDSTRDRHSDRSSAGDGSTSNARDKPSARDTRDRSPLR